jgi:Ca2+-binding RTX toxin-like protein
MANKGVTLWADQSEQTLTGTEFDDVLGGFHGASTLIGNGGDDTYYVVSSFNTVVETTGGGNDSVITWLSYTLVSDVENLQVLGADTIGIGNDLDNSIFGGEGRQQIFGAGGNDTLSGGTGDDLFIVRENSGSDVITDFEAGDLVQLGSYGFTNYSAVLDQMQQSGSDVVIQLNAGETLTFRNRSIADFSADDFQYALDTTKLDLTFRDEFDSLSLQSGGGTWRTSFWDGEGGRSLASNGELQVYMDEAYLGLGVNPFSVQDGILNIHADTASADVQAETGYDYTSGMLSSRDSFTQTYGYFEIKCQMPEGQGTWPAFWMLPADGSWPPELDVVEALGSDSSTYFMTAHSNSTGEHTKTGFTSWVGDITDGMHSYGVLWTPDELVWYVDGAEVFRTATPADMHQPMYMVTNLAIGGVLPGAPDSDFSGADLKIDYIRAYQLNDGSIPSTVTSGVTTTLDHIAVALVLTGTLDINGTGNGLDNTLTGNSGNNILDGGAGADTMIGGLGNDSYLVDDTGDVVTEQPDEGLDTVNASVTHILSANVEILTLTGAAHINGTGNDLANTLTGNAGDNILNGADGADAMIGGAGDDSYFVDNSSDIVTEWSNGGNDGVYASVSHVLKSNVENLTLTGSGNINGTGNWAANTITGNAGNNVLDGGTDADRLAGAHGDDTYYIDNSADAVVENAGEGTDAVFSSVSYTLSANVENLTLTGSWSLGGTGNELANVLTGNSGANVLNGMGGADTMAGGTGNDTYYVDNAADIINEWSNAGTDAVYSSVSYALLTHAESLTLTGSGNLNATGNWLSNTLTGNAGDNVLDGGTGADAMIGDSGNDSYYVDNAGDVVTEWWNRGIDTVYASASYVLAANVEKLTLTGIWSLNGTGNDLANVLIGNQGVNILDGAAGADTLIGGAGNDTYLVDNWNDVVTEEVGGGRDLVKSSITYRLATNVDDLALVGSSNINATGNELNNALAGNSGNNVLDGGTGADAMSGGAGNDSYTVDNAGDAVTEWWNSGTDGVNASVSFTLSANVENLTLTGAARIDATGNDLANILTGNSADNALNGGAGADAMIGGAGNDTYHVDNVGDAITEWWGQGTDTVLSSVAFTLSANVENLTLTGSASISGTGNDLVNELVGNAGANVLIGGAGADRLTGGGGTDTFRFLSQGESTVASHDVIADFSRGDLVDLSAVYGSTLTYHHDRAFTGQAGEVQLTASGDGVLVNIDLTGDKASDMQIYLANVSIGAMQESGGDFLL